ncbi:right-handed parallel beta-helix repeat-containing protein [bacterium SCSIO 12696]|nr:right-handed parallel beta-helix repeat-containing protein [bacterium SCSIO 12696]
MKKQGIKSVSIFLRFFLFSFVSNVLASSSTDLYMRVDGNDLNAGTHYKYDAVRTLKRAFELAKSEFQNVDTVRILVRPGIYYVGNEGESSVIDSDFIAGLTNPGRKTLVIQTHYFSSQPFARAIFDGRTSPLDSDGSQCRLFISIDGAEALPSSDGNVIPLPAFPKVVVRGLEFHYMKNPIRLLGSGYHEIVANRFVRIGNKYSCSGSAYAALGVSSSSNNLIIGNDFHLIENSTGVEGLHSIYISKSSSSNRILGNSFYKFSGTAIKLRDSSDDNEISFNKFFNSTMDSSNPKPAIHANFVSQSYDECPTVGNLAKANQMIFSPLPSLADSGSDRLWGLWSSFSGSYDCPGRNESDGVDPWNQIIHLDDQGVEYNSEYGPGENKPYFIRTYYSDKGYNYNLVHPGDFRTYPNFGFCPSSGMCKIDNGSCIMNGDEVVGYMCSGGNLIKK